MPDTKDLEKCSFCSQVSCGEPFPEGKNDDDLYSLNCTRNCSQLSTSSTMSQNFTPIFVYRRRRHHKNPVSFFTIETSSGTNPSDGFNSTTSSEAPSMSAQQNMVPVTIMPPVECNTVATVSLNCSSSKSNLEVSSAQLKIDMDDAGECSSSGALIADKGREEISERDICISILKSQGILHKKDRASTVKTGVRSGKYCLKSCKVCEHSESTLNLLVCDNCDDGYHVSCCNRNIVPIGEWLCSSCLKKKHKILKEKSTSNSVNISTDIGRNRCSESEAELGSLEFMFRETEPYMSNVRIGDEFQANVPDGCGPIDDECDLFGDRLEMDLYFNTEQDRDSTKPLKLTSIGNWLQCREEGVDGTICAKWRRVPLFEVQTDEWECFRCVLWDPAHADCSVPQELETEEIMKQLKYIEMLRPQLAAKRRKLDCSKSSNGS